MCAAYSKSKVVQRCLSDRLARHPCEFKRSCKVEDCPGDRPHPAAASVPWYPADVSHRSRTCINAYCHGSKLMDGLHQGVIIAAGDLDKATETPDTCVIGGPAQGDKTRRT